MHHQNKQALIAIGSGGFLGSHSVILFRNMATYLNLKAISIFSVITEEWWFLGAITIISMYIYIIYRGILIASLCDDLFGKYTAFGITVWIAWQVIINISVNISIS